MKKSKKIFFVIILILCVIFTMVLIMVFGKNKIFKSNSSNNDFLPEAISEQSNLYENNNEINASEIVQSSSVAVQSVDTSKWDLTKVDIVYDTENVAVPVPKGYVAADADSEHTVNTGFVIYEGSTAVTNDNAWDESCNRNQWVWVPVPDVSRIYETNSAGQKVSKLYAYNSTGRITYANNGYEPGVITIDNEKYFARYKLQGLKREKLLQDMQEEFDATIKSIEIYGGFWIGRYETGNLKEEKPVIQRMNQSINYQNWYNEYLNIQKIGAGPNVKTNVIFGSLWDETLQWFIDSGNKTLDDMLDCKSWGNCSDASFEYKKANGTTATKVDTERSIIPTGSSEHNKANNIYDMSGNVWEWTLEGYTVNNRRRYRGGDYNSLGTNGKAYDRGGEDPYKAYNFLGVRSYMYIK